MTPAIALSEKVHPLALNGHEGAVYPQQVRGFNNFETPILAQDDGIIFGDPSPADPEARRQKFDQKKMFAKAFKESRMSLGEMAPYRVRAAWRVIRQQCVITGILSHESLLNELPEEAPDALKGLDIFKRPNHTKNIKPPVFSGQAQYLIGIFKRCENEADYYPFKAMHPTKDVLITQTGVGWSLLPPAIPCDNNDDPDYDPQDDIGLLYWMEAFDHVAKSLAVSRGSRKDPDQGRFGLIGMNNPDLVRLACPARIEILFWELFLVDETIKLLAMMGDQRAELLLREYYGLLPMEVEPLISFARRKILDNTNLDIEEQRAVIVLRINNVMDRARESFDMRAELLGLKQLSQVVGIGRVEPEDFHKMFKKVVTESHTPRTLEILPDAPEETEDDNDVGAL